MGLHDFVPLSEPSPSTVKASVACGMEFWAHAEWNFGLSFFSADMFLNRLSEVLKLSFPVSELNVIGVENLCDSRSVGMYRTQFLLG